MKKNLFIVLSSFLFLILTSCDFKINNLIEKDGTNEDGTSQVVYNIEKHSSKDNCKHEFINDVCSICNTEKNEYIFSIFGEETIIYHNEDFNPYNINLNNYGEDIYAVFYDPIFEGDPYQKVNKNSFYSNYKESISYEDSYYRSQHGLMSGDINEQGHLPGNSAIKENNKYVKCSTSTYILDTNGNYIAYVLNDFNGKNDIIYYGGAYTSLNEVSAYLLAFGEVPCNSNYDKDDGVLSSLATWGKYGRVNTDYFSGNTNTWPYEPELPEVHLKNYTETDFGTIGGYSNISVSKTYNQKVYNNGSIISRGAARLVFVSDSRVKSIDERYVFYTYNHYNDFQEYLNYNNGFGLRFGNESAGNQYCASRSDFYNSAKNDPTDYPKTINKKFTDLIS